MVDLPCHAAGCEVARLSRPVGVGPTIAHNGACAVRAGKVVAGRLKLVKLTGQAEAAMWPGAPPVSAKGCHQTPNPSHPFTG